MQFQGQVLKPTASLSMHILPSRSGRRQLVVDKRNGQTSAFSSRRQRQCVDDKTMYRYGRLQLVCSHCSDLNAPYGWWRCGRQFVDKSSVYSAPWILTDEA